MKITITIEGPRGCGKTWLMKQLAAKIAESRVIADDGFELVTDYDPDGPATETLILRTNGLTSLPF